MIRPVVCLLLISGCLTFGCKRKRSSGEGSTVGAADAPAAGGGTSSATPKVFPGIPIPKEKPWAERTKQEKHDTYIFWLSQLKGADVARQAPLIAKIQAAGLSVADRADLEKLREQYSVPRFNF